MPAITVFCAFVKSYSKIMLTGKVLTCTSTQPSELEAFAKNWVFKDWAIPMTKGEGVPIELESLSHTMCANCIQE